jgi:pimeloyl-ACP methyl ester carboxylesterase
MKPVVVQKSYFNSFDDTRIYYELHGDTGPVVVLIYGVACQMNHWVYQVSNLSQDHRVLLFDYRGHHKSEASNNLTMETVAQDLGALLDHLKIEKAHIVGHSFGVPVGVKFANLFSHKTSSIVCINGFVYNPLDELFKFPVSKKLIEYLYTFQTFAPSLSQWLWEKSVNNILTQLGAGLLGGFNLELISFKDIEIYTQALENLKVEVVLKYMEDLVNADLRDDLKTIPDAAIERIKDGSHCTQLDMPETVNALLRDFFVSQHKK